MIDLILAEESHWDGKSRTSWRRYFQGGYPPVVGNIMCFSNQSPYGRRRDDLCDETDLERRNSDARYTSMTAPPSRHISTKDTHLILDTLQRKRSIYWQQLYLVLTTNHANGILSRHREVKSSK